MTFGDLNAQNMLHNLNIMVQGCIPYYRAMLNGYMNSVKYKETER